jgi:hypothetical protein
MDPFSKVLNYVGYRHVPPVEVTCLPAWLQWDRHFRRDDFEKEGNGFIAANRDPSAARKSVVAISYVRKEPSLLLSGLQTIRMPN